MNTAEYIERYLNEAKEIIQRVDVASIQNVLKTILKVKENKGRIFILGVGGSAANASHLVNDLRKIANIEAYAPTDNVSELTARTNDDGWGSTFVNWLKTSKLSGNDAIFILSVGGGNLEKNISPNLVEALKHAREVKAGIIGIVGKDGGYTAKVADACVIIPTISADTITPHAEAFQGVIWHLIVSHPALKVNEMKWESVK